MDAVGVVGIVANQAERRRRSRDKRGLVGAGGAHEISRVVGARGAGSQATDAGPRRRFVDPGPRRRVQAVQHQPRVVAGREIELEAAGGSKRSLLSGRR